jgi:hypothetical protein
MSLAPAAAEHAALPADDDAASAGSWLDGESAAWTASLLVHLAALGLLTVASLVLPDRSQELDLALVPLEPIEQFDLSQEFVSSETPQDEIGALAQAGTDGALASAPDYSDQTLVAFEPDLTANLADRPATELATFRAPEMTQRLSVQGAGSVGASGAAGAIDRLTHEILVSLEEHPTLVVWLFDESGSLREERATILKRFRKIYEELGVIEAADNPAFRKHEDKPLLTSVVAFGAAPRLMIDAPTDRIEHIERAVKNIEEAEVDWYADNARLNDEQRQALRRQLSQENVFQAVGMVAEKFRSYRSASQGKRHVMIVVFTDEAGDDVAALDDTVDLCRRLAMRVYVVGRPAPFGRDMAYVKWIDPDPRYDQRPQWVPVRLGPESLMVESLKLRFAGDGNDEPLVDSGFGPYALTRLCYETGGLYFTAHPNRVVGREVSAGEISNLSAHFTAFFDEDAMRRYQPDYVPAAEYMRLVQTNRARRALVEAAQLSWTSQMENIRLRFPKRDEAELAQALSLAQRNAAVLQPKLDMLARTLLAGEEDRDSIDQPRWRAGYDLALGRALAAKVRTDGYNMMLAEAKQGQPFKNEKNNTWVLRPAEEFSATDVEKLAAKARKYLERVSKEHPGTPWAMQADRELATPLGWRWDEDYTFIPPPNDGNARPRPPRPEPMEPQGPPRRDPPPL